VRGATADRGSPIAGGGAGGSAPRGIDRAAPPVEPAAAPPAAADIQRGPPRVVMMEAPPVELPRQESFQVLDAGKGARAPLRYTFATRTTAVMARSQLTSRQLERGAFGKPVALPAIRDGFEIATAADHPERLTLHALPAKLAARSGDASAYLAPWRTLLQGRRFTVAIDNRGGLTAVRFDDDPSGLASERARDELTQRLLALIVPLPYEPVGTGASWRAVTILRQGPAIAKQTATYTLVSRTAARWKLKVKLQRVGEQQDIADPTLPPGTSSELVALFRALEGTVEIDPELPLIAAGGLTLESRLHARLQLPQAPGQTERPAAVEQMFEDTGKITVVACRPSSPAPPRPPAAADALTACPDGYAP
jgi:hypothetical protein